MVDPRSVGDALRQLGLGDIEEQHHADLPSGPLQHLVERLRLRHSAGKAVEKHAALRVGLGQAALDEAQHHVVGDEAAVLHDRPDLTAQARPGRDLVAQHVTRAHVGHAKPLGNDRSLRPLAAARGAEDDGDQRMKPLY
jgi:hypothetical protein